MYHAGVDKSLLPLLPSLGKILSFTMPTLIMRNRSYSIETKKTKGSPPSVTNKYKTMKINASASFSFSAGHCPSRRYRVNVSVISEERSISSDSTLETSRSYNPDLKSAVVNGNVVIFPTIYRE